MAQTLAEVVSVTKVSKADIESWVEQHWVLPVKEGERWLFDDADIARVSLIAELRDLDIDDEAMPVVLRLLDQVYALRAALEEMREAIQGLPDAHRQALETRIKEVLDRHGSGGSRSY